MQVRSLFTIEFFPKINWCLYRHLCDVPEGFGKIKPESVYG